MLTCSASFFSPTDDEDVGFAGGFFGVWRLQIWAYWWRDYWRPEAGGHRSLQWWVCQSSTCVWAFADVHFPITQRSLPLALKPTLPLFFLSQRRVLSSSASCFQLELEGLASTLRVQTQSSYTTLTGILTMTSKYWFHIFTLACFCFCF